VREGAVWVCLKVRLEYSQKGCRVWRLFTDIETWRLKMCVKVRLEYNICKCHIHTYTYVCMHIHICMYIYLLANGESV